MSGIVHDIVDFGKNLVGNVIDPFKPNPPDIPQPPQMPHTPKPPTVNDPNVARAVDQERKRQRAARGRSSTILTGGSELGEPSTNRKTILGG